MRVAVIGAGIVGVTTAYELAALGHEVTVIERRNSVAAEASFGGAGVIAPARVAPWTAPGTPGKVLRHLFGRHSPVHFRGLGAIAQLPWLWRWWRACRPAVHAANRQAMWRLANFSRDRLLELTRALRLDYQQTPGCLVLLRGERELAAARGGLALLRELGVGHELIDAARCRQLEPALQPGTALHAAIHLPVDGVGNCRHFAHLLKDEAQKLGASFRFDTVVRAIAAGRPAQVTTSDGQRLGFDALVVCAGAQAGALLRGVGMRLPLTPVYGYSITAPIRHLDGQPPLVPRAAVMDERFKVAITRLGQRIRVAGTVEIGGRAGELAPAPLQTLYRVLEDWFPGAARTQAAQHWKGARPMLPDGPPVLGDSGAQGIWLNLGHGDSGWALACGSARVLAEQISGREAPLDITGLSVARWR